MVFNVLGLLVHDIAMEAPIVHVQWVGDMSAPSVLPRRLSSLWPDPGLAVGDDRGGEATLRADEEEGTIRKTDRPWKDRGNALPFVKTRTLFSAETGRGGPSRRPSDGILGSPSAMESPRERGQERPRTKTLIRPRIVTETFRSPTSPTEGSSRAEYLDLTTANHPLLTPSEQASSKQPPASNFPFSQDLPQDHVSAAYPHPSQDRDFSDPEWFTPPSTRREPRKASRHQISPQASWDWDRVPIATTQKPSPQNPPPIPMSSVQPRTHAETLSPTAPTDTASPEWAQTSDPPAQVRASPSPTHAMRASIARVRRPTAARTSYASQPSATRSTPMDETLAPPASPSSIYSRKTCSLFLHQTTPLPTAQPQPYTHDEDEDEVKNTNANHAQEKTPPSPSPPDHTDPNLLGTVPGHHLPALGSRAKMELETLFLREIGALREHQEWLGGEVVALRREVGALRGEVRRGGRRRGRRNGEEGMMDDG